jgi:HEPN domain-containing protein
MYHSIELFLKFLILKKGGKIKNNHHIRSLNEMYKDLSSKEEHFKIDLPFIANYLGFSKETEEELIEGENKNEGEQIFRYPTNKNGEIFEDIVAFCPKKSLKICNDLIEEFRRIELY